MPQFKTETPLESLTAKQYIALALITVEKLNWKPCLVSETKLIAEQPMSFRSNTWGETISITVDNEMVTVLSKSDGGGLTDFGRNRKNVQKYLDTFKEVQVQATEPEIADKLLIIEQQEGLDTAGTESVPAKDDKWWNIFIPGKHLFITPLLLDINIVLFILMVIASGSFETVFLPETDVLVKWGANYKPSTVDGQWWRLFTCMFEHIGILHLAMNMYALLYIGVFLEPLLGKLRFTVAYIVTGIFASLASLWWHDNTVSAGASGAIFGLYGLFLGLLLTNLIEAEARAAMLKSIGIFVVYNLVFGMKSGVDNAAHVGGLLSGALTGFLYYLTLRKPENSSLNKIVTAVLVAVTMAGVFIVSRVVHDPVGDYLKLMNQFSVYEQKALDVHHLPQNTSTEALLEEINKNSIPGWKHCEQLVTDINRLDLPDNLKSKGKLLKDYTETRLEFVSLLKKALEENTNIYDSALQQKNTAIKQILEEINKSSQ